MKNNNKSIWRDDLTEEQINEARQKLNEYFERIADIRGEAYETDN